MKNVIYVCNRKTEYVKVVVVDEDVFYGAGFRIGTNPAVVISGSREWLPTDVVLAKTPDGDIVILCGNSINVVLDSELVNENI